MLVGIVAKRGNRRASFLAADIRDRLREADVEVWLDEATAEEHEQSGRPVSAMDACDLVVAIGGDGTFLFAARGVGDTPIVGVNLGEVGFLNAIGPEDAVEKVLNEAEALRTGELSVREAPRLVAAGDDWVSPAAVNEIVLQGAQRGPAGGVDLEIRVDGSLFSSGRADGVLAATPTGSTAYNLSEGGPLVHPDVEAVVLNEMCAEAGMPPLAVGLDSEITVRLTGTPEAHVIVDGRVTRSPDPPTTVTIRTADTPIRLAGPDAEFFDALNKLE
ncbi:MULTISPECIES: NAD(+)/NADH kinase [Halolamina]|uniref:NAD kinase n=1 Tax=Halolamina pelagica TaxID=699431 RepID=A0A1I5MG04_9EURY|nr:MULTISPECIES: NAD(+)/NADH kinase [Halolamina]NHX36005.1 NAD(+)/NADH kinase [Halolamina sp. R1-12]SFP08429.1 NAD+ kinase [Halolamina pelagica]